MSDHTFAGYRVIEEIPVERMHDAAARAPIDETTYTLERELAEWKELAALQSQDATRQSRTILQLRKRLEQTAHQAPHLGPGTWPHRETATTPVQFDYVHYERMLTGQHDFYVESFGVALRPDANYVLLNAEQLRADVNALRESTRCLLICRSSNRVILDAPLSVFGGALRQTFPRHSEIEWRLHFPSWHTTRKLNYEKWSATMWARGRRIYDYPDLTARR